jgi:hypothetical protein
MLEGIVWRGFSVVCVFVIISLFRKLRKQLRGADRKCLYRTLGIGTLAGLLGGLLGYLMGRGFSIFLAPETDAGSTARLVFVALFFLLSAVFTGLEAGRIFPAVCRKDAVFTLTVMTSALLVMPHFVYGWFMLVRSLFP